MFSSSSSSSSCPPTKQPFAPTSTQGQGGFNLAMPELEGPEEASMPAIPTYEPDAMAMVHFAIHAGKMVRSFAKLDPGCPTTQLAHMGFAKNFPNLPVKIDYNHHTEMKYTLSAAQKKTIEGWIQQLHTVMNHKLPHEGKEYAVSVYVQHKHPGVWKFIEQHVQMMKILNVSSKMDKMSEQSRNFVWKFTDLLYKDAKKFMGFRNLEKLIPEEMRTKLGGMLEQTQANPNTAGFGLGQDDLQNMMKQMDPTMIQTLIGNVFKSPEETQKIMQSVGDLAGQDMGSFAGLLKNVFPTAHGQ